MGTTILDMELRYQQLADWLIDGKPVNWCLEQGSKQFGVSRITVRGYLPEVQERVLERLKASRGTKLAWVFAKQEELFEAALKADDLNLARNILMDIAKLIGANDQTVNVQVNAGRQTETRLAQVCNDVLEALIEGGKEREIVGADSSNVVDVEAEE